MLSKIPTGFLIGLTIISGAWVVESDIWWLSLIWAVITATLAEEVAERIDNGKR